MHAQPALASPGLLTSREMSSNEASPSASRRCRMAGVMTTTGWARSSGRHSPLATVWPPHRQATRQRRGSSKGGEVRNSAAGERQTGRQAAVGRCIKHAEPGWKEATKEAAGRCQLVFFATLQLQFCFLVIPHPLAGRRGLRWGPGRRSWRWGCAPTAARCAAPQSPSAGRAECARRQSFKQQ